MLSLMNCKMIEQLNAPLSKCHTQLCKQEGEGGWGGCNQFCRNLWELVPPQNIIMCAITTDLSLIALIQSLNPRNSVKVDKLKCNSIHTVWLHYNVDHCNGLRSLMWYKILRKLSEHVNKGWHSCFWSRLDDRPGGKWLHRKHLHRELFSLNCIMLQCIMFEMGLHCGAKLLLGHFAANR